MKERVSTDPAHEARMRTRAIHRLSPGTGSALLRSQSRNHRPARYSRRRRSQSAVAPRPTSRNVAGSGTTWSDVPTISPEPR